MTTHKQVFATVKTLVDSGIKDVVETLNRIPNVWTVDSCEGGGDEDAEICLYCGQAKSNYKASAYFANGLFTAAYDKGCSLDVYLEWNRATSYSPLIQLYFDKSESKKLSAAFSSAFSSRPCVQETNSAAPIARVAACFGGR